LGGVANPRLSQPDPLLPSPGLAGDGYAFDYQPVGAGGLGGVLEEILGGFEGFWGAPLTPLLPRGRIWAPGFTPRAETTLDPSWGASGTAGTR